MPDILKPVVFNHTEAPSSIFDYHPKPTKKEMVGVDVFLDSSLSSEEIGKRASSVKIDDIALRLITNRGVKVWPGKMEETFMSDHWRLQYRPDDGKIMTHAQIVALLDSITKTGLDFIKIETLCTFDGKPGYSLAQGE